MGSPRQPGRAPKPCSFTRRHAVKGELPSLPRARPSATISRKLAGVADCGYWYRNGGVVAQNLEAAKCGALCDMCHILDPSSNAANCNRADPAKRTQAAHTTDRHFAKQVRWAGYRKTNRDYVNALKRRVGRCERADCPGDGPRSLKENRHF